MNRFKRICGIAMVCLFLAGCVVKPPIQHSKELPIQKEITFLFPKSITTVSSQNQPSNFLNTLLVDSYYKSLDRWTIESQKGKFSPGSCGIERYRAYRNPDTNKEGKRQSISYECMINESEILQKSSTILRFTKERIYVDHDNLTGAPLDYKLQFSLDNAIEVVKTAKLPIRIEIDSEYNTESTYSNFIRLTRREVLRGEGQKDPVTGKIFKDRFWARVDDGSEVAFRVETYPYRNGSKAIVYATIHGLSVGGNTIDFSRTYDALLKEIERIIKS